MRSAFFFLLLASVLVAAAEKPFWGARGAYLERQTAEQLAVADSLLKRYPPQDSLHGIERLAALSILDGILHDERLDGSPAVAAFARKRMADVADSLETHKEGGMRVFKLYNDGFIVATPSGTVAFDVVRGTLCADSLTLVPDSLMARLLKNCDMLLLTHNHGDHVDKAVIGMMLGAGKPVMGPHGPMLDGIEGVELIYPDSMAEVAPGLTVFPTFQDNLLNNIYILRTSEGFAFAHTGDLWFDGDTEAVEALGARLPAVDVLAAICWARDLGRLARCFRPRLLLTGHENELGHTIDHREAYWLSQKKLSRLPFSSALLAWGESVKLDAPREAPQD